MKAYRLIVSLQIATGVPSAAIVIAFLVAPQRTVSAFGPELLLGLVVIFAALTLDAVLSAGFMLNTAVKAAPFGRWTLRDKVPLSALNLRR